MNAPRAGPAPFGPSLFQGGRVALYAGDCLDVLDRLPENSVDSCVTDPPYHLAIGARASSGFMGQQWDGGDVAFRPETWAKVLRVLKPGAHLVAFAAPKNSHRMICAIEDAGFEVRDCLMWAFGTGFPKSHDVSKAIDRAAGAERRVTRVGQTKASEFAGKFDKACSSLRERRDIPVTDEAGEWTGWGTSLKPAYEPICLARKPISESSIAANVLRWGTGAINIDGCRVPGADEIPQFSRSMRGNKRSYDGGLANGSNRTGGTSSGRWPANVLHDGSEEVVAAFPDAPGQRSAVRGTEPSRPGYSGGFGGAPCHLPASDSGSAARFFYSSKADSQDRIGSRHPTVKPVDLIQYLVRLVTPRNGVVIDPFAGTGTTAEAASREGMRAILIEREAEYLADIARRMGLLLAGPDERVRERVKARGDTAVDAGPLFDRRPSEAGP